MIFPCPVCGNTSRVIRVSEIYFGALSHQTFQEIGDRILNQDLDELKDQPLNYPRSQTEVIQRFAPPLTPQQPFLLRLQPDEFAFLLAIVLGYAVYATWNSLGWTAVGLVAALALLYFLFRSKIFMEFQKKRAEQNQKRQEIEQEIEIWNRLMYCARDGLIYDPETQVQILPGKITDYLNETPKSHQG